MKLFLSYLFFIFSISSYTQTKVLSWNIENFGKSKSEADISFIANTIKNYDIVAIQEVVASYEGAQAVAKLAEDLNNNGNQWDYVVSDPTSSSAYKTERYAFIWKKNSIKRIGNAWLEKKYNLEIDREPFLCTFQSSETTFTLVTFHAITKSKQPETEIKYFKYLPEEYSNLNLIFAGDFNCPQSHSVFNPLKKMGYEPILVNQKTSLKKACKGDTCLASEFDNMFYNANKIKANKAGVISFYENFESLEGARMISDHIPIWVEFDFR
ncbi:endonuclease/exonuclease/phosphatase family protein [Flavobacterium sp.]|uniref:endonuclease/exonuclease/phosphatase family protein n=1 Tax=Flavobacterium sp. TaxID=239 RepID=UPI00286A40C0|nr:endonuclease/exonuclease/phosphatase family protein [Flavobacterium sp.]